MGLYIANVVDHQHEVFILSCLARVCLIFVNIFLIHVRNIFNDWLGRLHGLILYKNCLLILG